MKFRFIRSLVAASIFVATSSYAVDSQLTIDSLPTLAPESQHTTAAKRVTSRFTRSHYQHFNLNDDFSMRVFNRYLDMLDYNHSIFTEAEIAQFSKSAKELDDELKSGANDIAFALYNQSLRSRFERFQYALALLDKEMTFDNDDDIELDRSEAPWPKDRSQLNELWRQRVKYDALNLKLSGKESWSEIKETLIKRYNNAIKRISQSQSEDAFQAYMNAFAREIDPHTSYLSPRIAEAFQSEMNLSLEGIGAVLQMLDDYTVIRSLVVGGPASKSKGLTEGDRIIGVAQDGEDIVDVIGWRLDDVVSLIKGPKGSKVILQILPDKKGAKSHTVTIVRDEIRLEDRAAKSKVIEKDGKKIGVVEVPSFYVGLSEDTDKLLNTLVTDDNVDGIVVDLRNNGGGALSEAVSLSGLFIKSGPIVQVRDSYGRVNVSADTGNQISYQGPLTVLINRYSASASEIFAAAMQDYGRAIIIGENSFGKGTVQQHRTLNHIYDRFDNELGYVQYTIQKFYRINGGSTQNRGVIPDIIYPTPISPEETGESVEDNALPWDQIASTDYRKLADLSKSIQLLTNKHQQRIANDLEFQFILQDIEEYEAKKNKQRLSLNYTVRRAEEAKEEQLKLARINQRQKLLGKKQYRSLDDLPKDYEAPDPYLDESVSIMLDMVK